MKVFEGDYKNFKNRILSSENIGYFLTFLIYSFIIFKVDFSKYYAVIIEVVLFAIFISVAYYRSKRFFIQQISFDDNIISLQGEIFNNKWNKELNIKETNIELKGIPSRAGLTSVIFYIKLKNKKEYYFINSFNTFSDQEIIEIFNEFKNHKGEKIIMDEKIDLLRIQEKIEKCQ